MKEFFFYSSTWISRLIQTVNFNEKQTKLGFTVLYMLQVKIKVKVKIL